MLSKFVENKKIEQEIEILKRNSTITKLKNYDMNNFGRMLTQKFKDQNQRRSLLKEYTHIAN